MWQRFPGLLLWGNVDLKLCFHLFEDALALLIFKEADHSWSVNCDGSGAQRGYHTLQHFFSHLASCSMAMDLSGTFKNTLNNYLRSQKHWLIQYQKLTTSNIQSPLPSKISVSTCNTNVPHTFNPQMSSASNGKIDTWLMSANSWWQWIWMYFRMGGIMEMTVSLSMGVERNATIAVCFSLSIPFRVNTSILPSFSDTEEKPRAWWNSVHSLQYNMHSFSMSTGMLKRLGWDFKKLHAWLAKFWDIDVTTTLQSDTVE